VAEDLLGGDDDDDDNEFGATARFAPGVTISVIVKKSS
jgi:hypothetical protein